jgi:hypothetical protein
LGTVFEEFRVAFYGEGDLDGGLGVWGGNVEGGVVEVGDDLVDAVFRWATVYISLVVSSCEVAE